MNRDKLSKMIEMSQTKKTDEIRDYIGASSIGSDCLRQIWYQYKGVKATDVAPKVRRTWAIGKHLESLIIDWLGNAGFDITNLWTDLESKKVPSLKGHMDSIWMKKGIAYAIIEIKTAKDASFKVFVNKGCELWNPQYYAQVQAYMGMSGIYKSYILVLNKDNSELSDELIEFDEFYYSKLEEKAASIASSKNEPPRISGNPLWFQCKLCKYNKVCHG